MSLFKKRDAYKPFEYPWAYDAFVKSEQMHWLPREVPLNDDVKDWKSRLTSQEKSLLTQIFRFFTQADVDVAGAYIDRYLPKFKPPEVRMMLSSIAAREAVHMQAYSMLIDEIGMPEVEYSKFMEYQAMREKHEFMSCSRGMARDIAIFSAFGEGLQLFASFVILLNFTRFGKMKGMGQIVSWSIRDETHHVDSMIKLYHAMAQEADDSTVMTFGPVEGGLLESEIRLDARHMVDLEDKFIDLVFDGVEMEGITRDEVKQYIRYIADIRLKQLKLDPIYGVESNPLPWVDTIVFGKEHANFFETKATDYAKASMKGEWDDSAFDFADLQEQKFDSGDFSIWSKPGCPHCEAAAEMIASHGHTFDFEMHDTPEKIAEFKRVGFKTFPQIWQGGRHIGGLSELRQFLEGDKALARSQDDARVGTVIHAPHEGASCSLEGGCE